MVLNGYEIMRRLIGTENIKGASQDSVNGASLDIHLGDSFLVEIPPEGIGPNEVGFNPEGGAQGPNFTSVKGSVSLNPGQFCLGYATEYIKVPRDMCAFLIMRSTAGRIGADHMDSCWIDPGFEGHITLEIKNSLEYHNLRLNAGDRVAQLVFFDCGDAGAFSYAIKGRYQNQKGVNVAR